MSKMKNFVITKKVARHGSKGVILVPKILENELKPGTIVKLNIEIVKEAENE